MADEKNPESGGLTSVVPLTVVMALLANLLYSHLSPYQDERPSNHPLKDSYTAAQVVDARLWQDPFAAVDDASDETLTEQLSIIVAEGKKSSSQVDTSSALAKNQIYSGNMPDDGDDITIIAVTLPGGSYQEAAENRMRRRYAVLSGLANQGATPNDEQHIRYFHPKLEMDLQKRVPLEWWSRAESNNKKLLLLWVDESSLLVCPATKLNALLQTIPLNAQDAQAKKITYHYKVIGPNTSTLLRDMVREVKDAKDKTNVAECSERQGAKATQPKLGEINTEPIVYYSAGATASNQLLLKDALGHAEEGDTISTYLSEHGITLYRTTGTDLDMMDILVTELLVRQVKKSDHVVILSEWDTFYGRAMPNAFKDVWNSQDQGTNESVKVFGYMRGLDGKIPDKGDKGSSVTEKKPDNKVQDNSDTGALIESPEGQNQKDYLRRLADNIYQLDQNWEDQGESGVAAIGILGSDVHDKLMILEALRQYFPHKLFFTTDLDAAYNHPAKRLQTHNLLVASAFDLKLSPELQGEIPPFRDSYQTAFFLTTQKMLNDLVSPEQINMDESIFDQDLDLKLHDKISPFFHHLILRDCYMGAKTVLNGCDTVPINRQLPLLFEIGRSRPIPLPTIDEISLHWQGRKFGRSMTGFLDRYSGFLIGTPLSQLFIQLGNFSVIQNEDSTSIDTDNRSKLECSWNSGSDCNTELPYVLSTFKLHLKPKGVIGFLLAALFFSFFSSWFRKQLGQFTIGVIGALIPVFLLALTDRTIGLPEIWGSTVIWFLLAFVFKGVWKSKQIKPSLYLGLAVGVLLLMIYSYTPWWNEIYMNQYDAEPFYWLEGVSIWPSQLLRLSVVLFACVFGYLGHSRIKKMQEEFQEQVGDGNIPQTFAFPKEPAQFGYREVLFIGNWEIPKENTHPIYPNELWKKYLGYYGNNMKKGPLPLSGWGWRLMAHGFVFFGVAFFIITQTELPNLPARGDFAHLVNFWIILLAGLSTIFLITWLVENARLFERLIADLSANISLWSPKAKKWAIREKKVAPECVEDWLDIKLVARLTATMQPLIFGPVVCVALLLSARSPAIDDWNIPRGLEMVYIGMLLYAISAEVFLQQGAKSARKKAIDQLSKKISEQRNRTPPNPYSEVVIKRIEAEIERIKSLREGAFRPWYEWPLLQSFGGLGVLQYIAKAWESGGF